ncbi:MAG TPA: peroxiredoxin family protein [Ktedonobacteraceae bacterium]
MALETERTAVGSLAPNFTLAGSSGQISLSDYIGKQYVVLYFMREFSCSLCQKHVAQLKQMYSTLQSLSTAVLVIGGGSREKAEHLATKLQLPFPVLADADREVYHRYGLEKVMFSLQRSGIIVVDRQGHVSYLRPTTIPIAGLDRAALMRSLENVP